MTVTRETEEWPFEPIPGHAYTHEERIAGINESLADFEAGRVYTSEEVFKPYEQKIESVMKGLADIDAGRTFTMEQVRAKFPGV